MFIHLGNQSTTEKTITHWWWVGQPFKKHDGDTARGWFCLSRFPGRQYDVFMKDLAPVSACFMKSYVTKMKSNTTTVQQRTHPMSKQQQKTTTIQYHCMTECNTSTAGQHKIKMLNVFTVFQFSIQISQTQRIKKDIDNSKQQKKKKLHDQTEDDRVLRHSRLTRHKFIPK